MDDGRCAVPQWAYTLFARQSHATPPTRVSINGGGAALERACFCDAALLLGSTHIHVVVSRTY